MNYKITVIVFSFMLIIRLTDDTVFNWIFNFQIPDWFNFLYSTTIYTLIVVLMAANNEQLFRLNMDRPFLSLLLITGAVLFIWYLPFNIGLYILILIGLLIWASKNNLIVFPNFYISPLKLILYIVIGLIPLFILFLYYILHGVPIPVSNDSLIMRFLDANLIGVTFEEVLFRGVLWMFLIDLKLSERKVLYIQAIAFWLAHYDLFILQSFFTFWVALPLGLFYGHIIQKHKSITPTIICHFILNMVTSSMG